MKKVILVAALSMLALASCKKDYVCTYTDGSGDEQTFDYPNLSKTGKEAAEVSCDALDGKLTVK